MISTSPTDLQKIHDKLQDCLNCFPQNQNQFQAFWTQLRILACQIAFHVSKKEMEILQSCLELCCSYHMLKHDLDEFESCFLLLEPSYKLGETQIQPRKLNIYAIRLLCLLVMDRQEEFHMLLERLTSQEKNFPEIQFVCELERTLMTGSYLKAQELIADPPKGLTSVPTHLLADTLRQRTAMNLSKSHNSISAKRALELLKLTSIKELTDFIYKINYLVHMKDQTLKDIEISATYDIEPEPTSVCEVQWVLNGDTIDFIQKEKHLPVLHKSDLINFFMGYAGEMERIV